MTALAEDGFGRGRLAGMQGAGDEASALALVKMEGHQAGVADVRGEHAQGGIADQSHVVLRGLAAISRIAGSVKAASERILLCPGSVIPPGRPDSVCASAEDFCRSPHIFCPAREQSGQNGAEMESAAPLTLTDPELLTDWLERGRELSFHALVSRYAVLVRMAALRSGGGDEVLAAEAAQLTFILLARKARALSARKSLAGWLHLTAVLQVKNLVRQHRRESRKRLHLRASMENDPDSSTEPPPDHAAVWRELGPVLDNALAGLPDKYREPLLLRFYRSLSVAEIAATLGIATAAAQKRLDRATAKLRARLLRLDCAGNALTGARLTNFPLTSTSLAAVLLAGFAADSQAAAAASTTAAASAGAAAAATATAASVTAGGSGLSLLLTRIAALKTTTLLPPAVALLLAAVWLTPKYRALAALEAANRSPVQPQTTGKVGASSAAKPPAPQLNQFAAALSNAHSFDWARMIQLFSGDKKDMGINMRQYLAEQEISKRAQEMTREELAAAMDQIIALTQSMDERKAGDLIMRLGNFLLPSLLRQDALFALDHFAPLIGKGGRYGSLSPTLSKALGTWAATDAAAASAWLDRRIAAGAFASKTLKGENPERFWFETELLGPLLKADPAQAALRLQALEENQRREVLSRAATHDGGPGRDVFIRLARNSLRPEESARVIRWMMPGISTMDELPGATDFITEINASPVERDACVLKAAESVLTARIYREKVRVGNVDDLRQWIAAQAPDKADTITGQLMADIVYGSDQQSFEELVGMADRYDRETGGQEVLAAFLESCDQGGTRTKALSLAATLKDPARRAQVLKQLEPSPTNP